MTDSVPVSLEWAFWIDLNTFKMSRVRKAVPEGSVVISKSKENDSERSFVTSHFHLAHNTGLVDKKKPEVSELLSGRMADYMKRKRTWPPNARLARVLKNGAAEIVFQPSQYDRFSLTLTPRMIGGEVEQFLDGLAAYEDIDLGALALRVEPAKSGRASCRRCGAAIAKNEIRIGEPSVFQNHVSYGWYHLSCALQLLRGHTTGDLDGFSELSAADQQVILTAMEGIIE